MRAHKHTHLYSWWYKYGKRDLSVFKVAVAVGPVWAFHKTVDLHAAVPGFYRDRFEKKRQYPGSGSSFLGENTRAECPDWHRVTEKAAVTQITTCRNRILQQTPSVSKKKAAFFFCIGSTWPHEASRPTSLTFFLQNFCRLWREILLLAASDISLTRFGSRSAGNRRSFWHLRPPECCCRPRPVPLRPQRAVCLLMATSSGIMSLSSIIPHRSLEHDSEFTGLRRPQSQSQSPAVKSQWSSESDRHHDFYITCLEEKNTPGK